MIPIGILFIGYGSYSIQRADEIARAYREFFLDEAQKRRLEMATPRIQPLMGGPGAGFGASSYRSSGTLFIVLGLITIYAAFSQHTPRITAKPSASGPIATTLRIAHWQPPVKGIGIGPRKLLLRPIETPGVVNPLKSDKTSASATRATNSS